MGGGVSQKLYFLHFINSFVISHFKLKDFINLKNIVYIFILIYSYFYFEFLIDIIFIAKIKQLIHHKINFNLKSNFHYAKLSSLKYLNS